MKCQELIEQLGKSAMAPAWREDALRHIAACESCARRWSEERSLDERLREFASATEPHRASPRVRRELRAAFTAHHSSAAAAANVVSFADRRAERRAWTPARWTLAAAALLLALFALALVFWPRASEPRVQELANLGIDRPPVPPVVTPQPPPPAAHKTSARRAASTASASRTTSREQTSEFFPLTLAADEQAMSNGTLVRMEMSRSRLIAMGLPLQNEGSQDTLNAEVLLGDNGVAYAIRVVR